MTATAITAPKDLLRITDLSAPQLDAVLELAGDMRDGPGWWAGVRPGGTVACLFDPPSAGTRVAFEIAAHRLGMRAFSPPRSGGAEPPPGTDAIVVRTPAHAVLQEVARAATVPVVNAGTDDHDPCMALADLLTLRRRFGYLAGLRLAYAGAGGGVAHSLMEAGALAGMHVAVATPPGHLPDHEVTLGAIALAGEHGGSVRLGHDRRFAVAEADAVYTDASEPEQADRVAVAQALLHSIVTGRLER